MKKRLVRILAGLLAVGMLGGCSAPASGGGSGSGADSSAAGSQAGAPSGEKVTIRVALWDYSNTEYYKKMFDAFSAKHPDIQYEVVEFAADEYPTVIQTQLAGKQNFDVVFNKDLPTLSLLVSQGHIEPLDSFIAADSEFDTKNYSGLIEQLVVEGKTYGVPFRKDNSLLYYNKDLFDAAGVEYPKDGMTMQEYADLAEKMTSGSGNDKVYGAHMHTWPSNVTQYARRTEVYTPIDSSTYESLLPYYQTQLDLQSKGYIQDFGVLKSSSIHYSGVFYNQQAAMLEIGTWFINMLCENATFNWGVVSLPNDAGIGNEVAVGGVTPVSIGAYGKNKEAAWQFIKYICGEEGALVVAQSGILPGYGSDAVFEIFDSLPQTYPGAPEGLSEYIDLPYIIEFPMTAKAKDIITVIEEEHSAIMTGTAGPEEGLKRMMERVNAIQ